MDDEPGNTDPASDGKSRLSPTHGHLLLHTKSGTRYIIDLDLMLLRRLPADNAEPVFDLNAAQSATLRRDGQLLKILRIYRLAVGSRAQFDIETLGDPRFVAFTRRTTTEVLSIQQISPDPEHTEPIS